MRPIPVVMLLYAEVLVKINPARNGVFFVLGNRTVVMVAQFIVIAGFAKADAFDFLVIRSHAIPARIGAAFNWIAHYCFPC